LNSSIHFKALEKFLKELKGLAVAGDLN